MTISPRERMIHATLEIIKALEQQLRHHRDALERLLAASD